MYIYIYPIYFPCVYIYIYFSLGTSPRRCLQQRCGELRQRPALGDQQRADSARRDGQRGSGGPGCGGGASFAWALVEKWGDFSGLIVVNSGE